MAVHYSNMKSSMAVKNKRDFTTAAKLFSLPPSPPTPPYFLALLLPYWFILHLLVCSPPESRYLIPTSHLRHKVRRNGGKNTLRCTHALANTAVVGLNSLVSLPKERAPNRRWQRCCVPWTLLFTRRPSLTFAHTHTFTLASASLFFPPLTRIKIQT